MSQPCLERSDTEDASLNSDDYSGGKKPFKKKRKCALPLDLVSGEDEEETVTKEVIKHKKLLQDLSKKVDKSCNNPLASMVVAIYDNLFLLLCLNV